MSNLGARVASAVVMVPLIVAAVIWLPDFWWSIGISIVAGAAAREIARLAIGGGVDASGRLIEVATALLVWLGTGPPAEAEWLRGGEMLLAALIIVVVLAFVDQLARPPERRSVAAWALAVAVPTYVGGMASFTLRLRALDDGIAWVLCLLFLIWTNDSAAYFGGRAFGRHPLAPSLSPKKTWEGLAAGTAGTVAVAVGLAALAPGVASVWAVPLVPIALATAPIWIAAALGIAVSIAGPVGDLSHSFIKRQFGAKDSGAVIPGHGGVWDRVDSLLFAAPVVYLAARLLGA